MENAFADRVPLRLRRPARLLRLVSDERLVALVRSGDEGAFEALYDRHHPAILGFCRHMLGTREEAEDAVQHTFLAAFRDLVGSEKPIDLRPWLFAIARNRCLSLLRARRAHVAIELAEPATDGLAATVERREDLRELLADLACLPDDQRAALLLAELGALDHAGIAAVLDCPREKVKALVFQARTSLAASREARATPCEDVRGELAMATGAALRRGPLRRHLRTCAGCRAFKAEVATQRKLMALALPVVPSVALKASVIAGGGGGASLSSGVLGALTSSGAGKVAVSLAAVGAIAGGSALTTELERHHRPGPAADASPRVAVPLFDAPHVKSGQTTSPREPGHHDGRLRLHVGRAPVAVHRQALPPILVRDAERHPVPPGAGVPAKQEVPAPAPAPLPTPAPEAAAPPAPVTPPRHEHDRHPGGTPPGEGQTPPGQDRTEHGQNGTPPGQSKSSYGHSKASHHQNQSTTPPGQSQTPPGQSKSPASGSHNDDSGSHHGGGQSSHSSTAGGSSSGGAPANPGTPSPAAPASPVGENQASSPGRSDAAPGQANGSNGQSGNAHGHSG